MKLSFLILSVLTASVTIAASAEVLPQQAPPAARPFRIIFSAYDDPKNPEAMSFQINTVDIRQPSLFLKIGETIPNTNLRLLKFERKLERRNVEEGDYSELTVINIQTKVSTVLILGRLHILPAAAKNQ